MSEDPIGDGLNWYTYCGNNPITFIDPFGLERLVVSGGYYSNKLGYQYEFIDSALKEIESYSGKESKILMITDVGLTDADKEMIQRRADFYGYNVRYFTDAADLNDYINNGSDSNRADDPISKFRVFSHGYIGSVEFGHGLGLSSEDKEKLSWTIDKIKQLDPNAFKKTDSIFYSCNTGTQTNGTSFAQEWSNITGGKTKAAVGQTWYGDINSFVWWRADTCLTHRSLKEI